MNCNIINMLLMGGRQCSEQKQVQNGVYFDVALLAVVVIQAAKSRSFPVHFAVMFEFMRESLC